MSRLLLFLIALSILLLNGYGNPLFQRNHNSKGFAIAKIKHEPTSADLEKVKVGQSQTFTTFTSAVDKEKRAFKLDPAELEEEELNSFKKYLARFTYISSIFSVHLQGCYSQHTTHNSTCLRAQLSDLTTDNKHPLLQVFRI